MMIDPLAPHIGEPVTKKLTEWNQREIQLSRLHEEILIQREVMLNCSNAYLQSQDTRSVQESIERGRARARNEQFLQSLVTAQEELYLEACNPPSPRLTTLQNNYWAMVRNLKPLWEESFEKRTSSSNKKSSKQGSKHSKANPVSSAMKKSSTKESKSSKSGTKTLKKILRIETKKQT